ncbi:MAG TPA: O-antigen ligase family protein [Solirubrobacteraceae bacterium]
MSAVGAPLASTLPSSSTIVLGAIAAVIAIGALAFLMRRYEDALPLLAILALPFRVPISLESKTVNLLIPLYLVVAAGTLTRLLPAVLLRRRTGPDEAAREDRGRLLGGWRSLELWSSPRMLEATLLGAVVLYALQGIYSADHARAAENVVFFYVPFALLFLLLRDVTWRRELLIRCLGVAVALAVVFAGIGFVEYARKSLFLNPKVVAAHQYDNYFRVNSLFFDPNIYGRFLALVMIALATVVLWSRQRREVLLGAAALTWLLGGLITSFSQSSIAALLLGLAVLAAWRWDLRRTIYTSFAVVAIAGAVVLLAPTSLHFGLKGSSGSTSNATSGRTKLISGGVELFAKRPVQGFGSGSFEREYKSHSETTAENATSASHTIPVTVAAEQGVIGLVLYVALLISGMLVLFRGAGRSPPRIALAACLAALLLHTWTYADFLEDPFTWAILAIGVALARQARAEQPSSF